jgi:hypothetical protein
LHASYNGYSFGADRQKTTLYRIGEWIAIQSEKRLEISHERGDTLIGFTLQQKNNCCVTIFRFVIDFTSRNSGKFLVLFAEQLFSMMLFRAIVAVLITLVLVVGCNDHEEYERISMEGKIESIVDGIRIDSPVLKFKDGRSVDIYGEIPGRVHPGARVKIYIRRKNPEAAMTDYRQRARLEEPWHLDSLKVRE